MNQLLALDQLPLGKSAYVTALSNEPSMKRRLTDLGLIQGTCITCLCQSPWGDPRAYMIRGAVIALRQQDTSRILISPANPL